MIKKFIKYSKKSSDIQDIKKNFFSSNTQLLKSNKLIVKLLKKQPIRKNCKNCGFRMNTKSDFSSHNMEYKICKICSHLNSKYIDNLNFHKEIYDNDKFSYSKFYSKEYNKRVKKIYVPKVDFLIEFFKKKKIKNIKILDIGSGAGHFVKACQIRKIDAVGLEVNKKMVKVGEKFLTKGSLIHSINAQYSLNLIEKSNFTVVSLISVLEHLENPYEMFKSFNRSKNKYLFLSIPLFNLSVFIESIFQNVYPRHTAIMHPHIYSYESIQYVLKKYNLIICAEWWFGTEMLDLNRSFNVSFQKNKSQKFLDIFKKNFTNHIDMLQEIFDKKKLSSEVHLIIKKK